MSDQGQPSVTGSSAQSSTGSSEGQGQEGFDSEGFMEEFEGLKKQNRQLSEHVSKTSEVTDRLRQALGDGSMDQQTEQDWVDAFLEAAMDDQKKGGLGLPLTTKLAMKAKEAETRVAKLEKQLERLLERNKVENDPTVAADRQAYLSIDNHLQKSIENLYGDVDPQLFQAAAQKCTETIKQIQRDKPEQWAKIRRDPSYLQKLAQYHVEKIIPPRVRQMLESEKVKNTELSRKDLHDAFREADEKLHDQPENRAAMKAQIRQKMFEEMQNRKGR